MARAVAEQSNSLSVFFLKKHGYLSGSWMRGTVNWTSGWGYKSSIGVESKTKDNKPIAIRLNYTNTNYDGEKNKMDFEVSLNTTKCNYGGVRYWFVCPLYKNGVYCGRRVGVLYSIGKWFGCRYCGEIAYRSQFAGGFTKLAGSICEPDVEKAYKAVKREYYNGKPTRKYRRYLGLSKKMDRAWILAGQHFGMKF